MKYKKIKNKGFTLIEIMVTVVIIGILGAVVLPAYQDYTIRSQVTEGLSLASDSKVQITEYYANHGEFPKDMSDLGLVSSQGSFIEATALGAGGAILATFGNEANKNILGGMVSLIPIETSKGNLEWTCEANIEEKYLPTSCKVNENLNNDNNDGIITRPDGSIKYPDGSIIYHDGLISDPEGFLIISPELEAKYRNIPMGIDNLGFSTSLTLYDYYTGYNDALRLYRDGLLIGNDAYKASVVRNSWGIYRKAKSLRQSGVSEDQLPPVPIVLLNPGDDFNYQEFLQNGKYLGYKAAVGYDNTILWEYP